MAGDGVNVSLALKKVHVGIAQKRGKDGWFVFPMTTNSTLY